MSKFKVGKRRLKLGRTKPFFATKAYLRDLYKKVHDPQIKRAIKELLKAKKRPATERKQSHEHN